MHIIAEEMLTVTEAAFVADLTPHDVERAIDERILPDHLVSFDPYCRVTACSCAFIAFYYNEASRLPVAEWLSIILSEARKSTTLHSIASGGSFREAANVDDDGLSIELLTFIQDAAGRHADLVESRRMASSCDGILSGTPVIAGTRIPVHDIAASVAAGFGNERILEAYPALDAGKIRLATIYASIYPAGERPSPSTLRPARALTIKDKRLPRRKVGG